MSYLLLPNHRRLRIRSLRPQEEAPIRELYANLSPASRYQRFFSAMPTLPDAVLRHLSNVDGRRMMAFVAEEGDDRRHSPIALGSFGAVDDAIVEVALVVQDDWQHQGVGTLVATRVLEAAEARGFHRFSASMHAHNVAIRRLLARIGVVVSSKFCGGIAELEFVRRPLTT